MDGSDHHRGRSSRSHSLQPVHGGNSVRVNRSSLNTQPPVPNQAQAQPFGDNAAAQSAGFGHPHHTSYPRDTQHYGSRNETYRDSRGEYGSGDRHHPLPDGPSSRDGSLPSQIQSPPQQSHHTQYSALPPHPQYQGRDLDYSPRNPQQQPSAPQHPRTFGIPNIAAPSTPPGEPVEVVNPRDLRLFRRTFGFPSRPHPTCRYPNCSLPVRMDERTREPTEYCGQGHMREDIQRGVPLCIACHRHPCRWGSNYCGPHCESWSAQQTQQAHRHHRHDEP
ncbi:hypothetical protein BC826DRAFT_235643 [Russula brevipes]|nr:hypothetical protein BC826DRAFT_235643 [Russula brevipes]